MFLKSTTIQGVSGSGNMLTLSLVFNPTKDKVLMCFHKKIGMYNFLGGRASYDETGMDVSYRELQEESGITKDDIELVFVREEFARSRARYYEKHNLNNEWCIYVTAGVLKHNVILVPEKNELFWIDITDDDHFTKKSAGLGNCWLYLHEAMDILNIQ